MLQVLRSPFLTQGPAVPALERAAVARVGARHGVAVNSATSALPIACLALGLGPGDRALDLSSCDMAANGALAECYGFALLEDASHAIGGRYQGEPVGNCLHSAITVFSFHPVKIITTGEGGPGHHQRSAAGQAHGGTVQPRHRARGRAL